MNDIFVRLRALPRGINGLTILDADGDYNVYINQCLPESRRTEAYRHELKHIEDDDFYNDKPLVEAEMLDARF